VALPTLAPAATDDAPEDPAYLTTGLLTYLGNKRALLPHLESAVLTVRTALGGRRLRALDAFSGSGAVSRMLKRHSAVLVANDLEDYCRVVSTCHLANTADVPLAEVVRHVARINALMRGLGDGGPRGFVERLYAPADDDAVRPGERVFYTRDNARRLDVARQEIALLPTELQPFLLAPLLAEASVRANTSGVFKGFHKDRRTGLGKLGATHGDALARILAPVELRPPALSRFASEVRVLQRDASDLPGVDAAHDLDLVYLDPPYNQHPYGSNYFMLNLLTRYEEPSALSPVSGIPVDWTRSAWNVRARSTDLFAALAAGLDTRYLLVSFNDEGFIDPATMRLILDSLGEVSQMSLRHSTFRGSRNLRGRPLHVTEHLYLVRRR
jgi:adenine-specific DNA-methyltransferase